MPRDETADPIVVYKQTRQRIIYALVVLMGVSGLGAAGYWYLGYLHEPGHWSFRECLYMTAITITTVGFGETLDLDAVPGSRNWTLVLLLFGISANLYAVSSITSFFVESDFANVRRYRRLIKLMAEIRDHYIVCGAGRTGIHVVGELRAVGYSVVVIDQDRALLDEIGESLGALCVVGDATEDDVLDKAGLKRASGIVAALDDDKTNMFVVVTARQSRPDLRIVTKAVSPSAVGKLRRAGADAVVSPAFIGGMRIASEMVRPQVVRFLDEMLRDKQANLRIEEANAHDGPIVGKRLREAAVREATGALIIAVRNSAGGVTHIPDAEHTICAGDTLVAIGKPEDIAALRKAVGHRPSRPDIESSATMVVSARRP